MLRLTLLMSHEVRVIQIVEELARVLLRQKAESNATRDKDAVILLLGIQSDIEQYIVEIQNAKAEYTRSAGRDKNGDGFSNVVGVETSVTVNDTKSANQTVSHSDDDSMSSDSDGLSDTRGTSQLARNSSGGHTARLREARMLLHKVHFLLGDAYHRLGCVEDEDSSYGAAEHIRKQLLHHTEHRALQTMQLLRDRRSRGPEIRAQFGILLAENPDKKTAELVGVPHCDTGSMLKNGVSQFKEANDVISLLNKQAELLWQWV